MKHQEKKSQKDFKNKGENENISKEKTFSSTRAKGKNIGTRGDEQGTQGSTKGFSAKGGKKGNMP